MVVVSTVGGPEDVDRRQGWSGTPCPPELVEHLERQKAARGRVKHANEIRAEAEENQRKHEAEWRAQHPDVRAELRTAHEQRAAVQASWRGSRSYTEKRSPWSASWRPVRPRSGGAARAERRGGRGFGGGAQRGRGPAAGR
jgi:hypothetical protein